MRLALALLLLTATSAHAQGMDCRSAGGGRTTCTESFRSLADRIERQTDGRTAPPAGASAIPKPIAPKAMGAPPLTPKERRRVAAVARAIQAGRCDEARAIALEDGDYPLADQATKLCAPKADPG